MEGDSRVASAGTSHQTRTAMAGLERTQVPHNRLEKGSRIPIKSKIPQHVHQKKLTSQTQAPTSQNAITSHEKLGAACLEKEKAPNRLTSRVRPTTSGRRDGDDSTRGKAATNAESAKENVAPSSTATATTTSVNGGEQQLGHPMTNGIKKPSMKRCALGVCACV